MGAHPLQNIVIDGLISDYIIAVSQKNFKQAIETDSLMGPTLLLSSIYKKINCGSSRSIRKGGPRDS